MNLNLSSKHFKKIVLLLILLNIFFIGGTWLYTHVNKGFGNNIGFILLQFSLAYENVIGAWYSSIILSLVAVMCALCFMVDRERFKAKAGAFINFGWLMLCLIFLTLSFDELGSFHETIGETELFKSVEGSSSSGWGVFYILIIVVGVFMALFGWLRLRRPPASVIFIILGVLLFLSNPLQENFEINSWHNSPNPATWKRPVIFLLLEEGSEIFGTLCFLIATMIYYVYAVKQLNNNVANSLTNIATPKKSRVIWLTILFIILSIPILIFIEKYFQRIPDNEVGIPKNWFPVLTSFLVFLVSLYMFFRKKKSGNIYLVLSIVSILLSIYFGSDLYEHHFKGMRSGEKIFDVAVIMGMIFLSLKFFFKEKYLVGRILIATWALLFCMAFSIAKAYAPELVFAGFALLSISLIENIYREIRPVSIAGS